MAHEIYIDNGRASMMYAGDVPWHGLGVRVEGNATAAEAIKAANLDWTVVKLPLFASTGVLGVQVKDKFGIVREDKIGSPDCDVYGIVNGSYSILQNREAFSFFDRIVGRDNAAIYHTAGALGKGERIWILAKMPSSIQVIGDDIVDKYLLLGNSHDGSSSVQIKFTPIRVVCNNTLTFALKEGPTLRIPHFSNMQQRLFRAEEMLGIIHHGYADLEEAFHEMTKVQVDSKRLENYLTSVFPDPNEDAQPSAFERAQRNRAFAEHLFSEGKGNSMPGVKGTLWAAYNGVTEFIDQKIPVSADGRITMSGERRLNSIWFGQGSMIKAKAFTVAKDRLNDWRN